MAKQPKPLGPVQLEVLQYIAEAMAAGKPVVASNIAGYASVISDGGEGLLYPPKDDEALANAIGMLLKDHDLRQRLAANGRQMVEKFRWERVASRVMGYYKTFLDAPQPVLSR